jgi:hypothetical protein
LNKDLTENCPKWNNGYEGYDENGEPILDDKGDYNEKYVWIKNYGRTKKNNQFIQTYYCYKGEEKEGEN